MRYTFLVVWAAFACGCTSYGGPRPTALPVPEALAVEGIYVHEPSGMTFPATVGEFRRERVTKYDVEGLDVGVGYNLFAPPRLLAATVFVYPSPPCASVGGSAEAVRSMKEELGRREFERRRAEVLEMRRDAMLVSEGRFTLDQLGISWTGSRATFEYLGLLALRARRVRSELYLVCYVGDRWTVKYRFTHPVNGGEAADIEWFLRNFAWSLSEP